MTDIERQLRDALHFWLKRVQLDRLTDHERAQFHEAEQLIDSLREGR